MAASEPRVSNRRGPVACRGSSPVSHDTCTSTAATAEPRAPRQAEHDSARHHGSLAPSVPHYTLTASLSESRRCYNHETRPNACVDGQRRCSTTRPSENVAAMSGKLTFTIWVCARNLREWLNAVFPL